MGTASGMALTVAGAAGGRVADALWFVEVRDPPLLTTEETVWDTRGPIWARI